MSAGPSGTSSGGTGVPVSLVAPREPFGVWGRQQGFHIWPGNTEGAGGKDRARRVWTAPGSGPTCCRPRLGQGRAAMSRVPCGGWPRAGTPSPTVAALARACRPGQGDAVRAAGQHPAQWKGGGLRACPQPWPCGDSASGGLWASWTVVRPPHHVQEEGQAWPRGRDLSWCPAGTVAGARVARPPPAQGSRQGPPAARPSAWPVPSG